MERACPQAGAAAPTTTHTDARSYPGARARSCVHARGVGVGVSPSHHTRRPSLLRPTPANSEHREHRTAPLAARGGGTVTGAQRRAQRAAHQQLASDRVLIPAHGAVFVASNSCSLARGSNGGVPAGSPAHARWGAGRGFRAGDAGRRRAVLTSRCWPDAPPSTPSFSCLLCRLRSPVAARVVQPRPGTDDTADLCCKNRRRMATHARCRARTGRGCRRPPVSTLLPGPCVCPAARRYGEKPSPERGVWRQHAGSQRRRRGRRGDLPCDYRPVSAHLLALRAAGAPCDAALHPAGLISQARRRRRRCSEAYSRLRCCFARGNVHVRGIEGACARAHARAGRCACLRCANAR